MTFLDENNIEERIKALEKLAINFVAITELHKKAFKEIADGLDEVNKTQAANTMALNLLLESKGLLAPEELGRFRKKAEKIVAKQSHLLNQAREAEKRIREHRDFMEFSLN